MIRYGLRGVIIMILWFVYEFLIKVGYIEKIYILIDICI